MKGFTYEGLSPARKRWAERHIGTTINTKQGPLTIQSYTVGERGLGVWFVGTPAGVTKYKQWPKQKSRMEGQISTPVL